MMRLSALWNVDKLIDATGSSPLAEQIAARWEHDPGSVRFFRSSANFIYTARRGGRRSFLRFAPESERSREMIAAEMALLTWLSERGFVVTRPLLSRTGATIETVATGLGTYHAVMFDKCEGTQRDLAELDDRQFWAWGAALGRLHAALQGYTDPAMSARPTWRDHLQAARLQLPGNPPSLRAEFAQLATALGALPIDRASHGLIHFDFELDNLVWREGDLGLLDFDGCAHYWYAADIAFALRDIFDSGATLEHPAAREFVRGYRAHRPLDEQLLSRVPVFSRLARLLGYATMRRALALPPGGDYPEWLVRLQERFETRMAAYVASLGQNQDR